MMSAPGHWTVKLMTREIALRVALIENVSSQALEIGDFSVKEHSSTETRSDLDDRRGFETAGSALRQYFASGLLKPGEALLIPL